MKPLIIIPTFNEEENIKKLILDIFDNLKNINFSILVVDDSSIDNTLSEIEELNKKNISILKRPSKLGLASAYIDGINYGLKKGFDAFIEFDADFSHNPKYLAQMIDKLKDYDVVIGSRNIKNGSMKNRSLIRNLISIGGSMYAKIILNCPINDLTGGFNGWRKEIIEKIGLENIISKGYCFQVEMKYRAYLANAKITEFPIIFEDRKYGKSKMNKAIFFEAFLNILKLRIKLDNKSLPAFHK